MNKLPKWAKALIIPMVVILWPCFFNWPLFVRPEIWIAYFIGFTTILTQPNVSYCPGTSFYQTKSDKHSALGINLAVYFVTGVSVIGYICCPEVPYGVSHISGLVLGSLFALKGLFVRVYAIQTLGKMFTTAVQIVEEHCLITHGPFRIVRHPSYLGAILAFTGIPLLFSLWFFVPVAFAVLFIAYVYRISVEEKLLIEHFGQEYIQYKAKTFRIFPYIF